MIFVEIYSRQTTKITHSLSGMKQTSSTQSKPCPPDIHADGTGVYPQEDYVPGVHFKLVQKVT